MSHSSICKKLKVSEQSDYRDLKLTQQIICVACFGFVVALSAGCWSNSPRVRPPSISAKDAGTAAVAEFDQDSDQKLSASELKLAPGIQLVSLDSDSNGYLSSSEISQQITQWQESGIGQLSHSLLVKLDSKPLAGAKVTLEPYSFLGPNVLPATGVTDDNGVVVLAIEKSARAVPNIPTMQFGFYRIRISKMLGDQELIPKRYNLESRLGCEVAPTQRAASKMINLSSKR